MRTIYVKYFCDNDIGEADAFFDVSGLKKELVLITAWSTNDASYRDEYMSSLFEYLGVKIKPLPAKYDKQALSKIKELWGY